MSFNHFDSEGRAVMVDVSGKSPNHRQACAEAVVELGTKILALVLDRTVTKGDVLGVARLAGIGAVKKVPELIPLAHPLSIQQAAIEFATDPATGVLRILCTVRAVERTGVEMEAVTGATVAALTVYDMCKGEDKGITIGPIRLLSKHGGKSGSYVLDPEGSR